MSSASSLGCAVSPARNVTVTIMARSVRKVVLPPGQDIKSCVHWRATTRKQSHQKDAPTHAVASSTELGRQSPRFRKGNA